MNLIKPEWKVIAGYEGLYKVSNTGLVRCLNRDIYDACGKWISYRKGCVLIPFYSRKYKCVKLCKGGLEKSVFVHRLVAMTFVPNPDNKPEVNHIDGDTTNNVFTNLEWVTKKENMQHAI